MSARRTARATALVGALALIGAATAAAQDAGGAPSRTGPPAAAPRAPFDSEPLGEGPWLLDTERQRIRVTVIARDLERPWGLAFLPNGDMLVTERPGRLRVIRDGALDPTPIAGLPAIRAAVIGGLMDIALHPQFERNRLVYFSYSKPDAAEPSISTLAVARARWDGGAALADVEDVFVADDWYGPSMASQNNRCCGQGPADGSFGARMVFGPDGLLYVTSGDRNWGERAQDPSSHLGKIIRIRDDGSVPADNPFVGREGYQPEIFSLGHRNPTGLTIHPRTGELWSTEFGPRGGDELNRIVAGGNYGWILTTRGQHYNGDPADRGADRVPGLIEPVLFWVPSINPGNLVFYEGDRFPAWRDDMLMAAMSRTLLSVTFDQDGRPTGQERMLTELGQRLRDVRQGPDGLLYVLTDERAGALLRIEPAD
ncbi:MAG TPA: PQQ-dependent sugar dehydrogenase [Gammaproteobacteria bacterium]